MRRRSFLRSMLGAAVTAVTVDLGMAAKLVVEKQSFIKPKVILDPPLQITERSLQEAMDHVCLYGKPPEWWCVPKDHEELIERDLEIASFMGNHYDGRYLDRLAGGVPNETL